MFSREINFKNNKIFHYNSTLNIEKFSHLLYLKHNKQKYVSPNCILIELFLNKFKFLNYIILVSLSILNITYIILIFIIVDRIRIIINNLVKVLLKENDCLLVKPLLNNDFFFYI